MSKQARIIPMSGVKNFRDMGGYSSADGRTMQWGRLFRSGHLAEMTEVCGTEILARDIETVIDFRSDAEKVRHPVQWPFGWAPEYHPTPIGGNAAAWVKELYDQLAKTDFPAQALRQQFILAFKTIPIDNQQGLKTFFDITADPRSGRALLFHCTAGKDRTGIAGALLMKALGISEDQIMHDFLLTNDAVDLDSTSATIAEWLSRKAGQTIKPSDVLPLVGVEADFLEASYQAIRHDFGTIEAYLEHAMGLTAKRRAALQDIYLE